MIYTDGKAKGSELIEDSHNYCCEHGNENFAS